jgi:hypothetical protein
MGEVPLYSCPGGWLPRFSWLGGRKVLRPRHPPTSHLGWTIFLSRLHRVEFGPLTVKQIRADRTLNSSNISLTAV